MGGLAFPRQRGALIGCGHISQPQLRAWQQIAAAEIVAVCDLDETRARLRAAQFDIAAVYTDYRRMLAEVELDFVDIATRPSTHLELVTAAAQGGLHVLCQKPIAATLAELRDMIAVCQAAGVIFGVNENTRHQAWFRRMKALLDAGALGQPYYARFETRSRSSLPVASFDAQPYLQEMPRLVVYEEGVHYLDTARFLFGEAATVYARLRKVSPHIAGEDVALLVAAFGGLTCLVDDSWASVPEPGPEITWGPMRLEGTAGTLSLGRDGVLTLYTDDKQQSWAFPADTVGQSFVAAQQHFINCLETGQQPETSGPETLKTMALVFAAYRSAADGRVVAVDELLAEA